MYNKKGVEYRPTYCYYDDTTKILISKFGLRGYAIQQLLYNKIFLEHGYYLQFNDDILQLFAMEIKAQPNLVQQIIDYMLERGLFDDNMYKNFSVLTSEWIQQEYARITYKRVNQWHTPQYVMSSVIQLPQNDGRINQNDSNLDEKDDEINTEKRTAEQSESQRKSDSIVESKTKGEPTPAQLLSQKLNKQLKNQNLAIDTNKINIDELCARVLESDFLQNASNLDIDWLIKHYDEVISGKYKTIGRGKAQNPALLHQRHYTAEDYKEVEEIQRQKFEEYANEAAKSIAQTQANKTEPQTTTNLIKESTNYGHSLTDIF